MFAAHRPPRRRAHPPCPACGTTLRRVPRTPADRAALRHGSSSALRRYRCAAAGCGWEGLLDPQAAPPGAKRGRQAWTAALSLAALAAGAGWYALAPTTPATSHAERMRALPPGISDDGEPLPPDHVWLRLPGSSDAAALATGSLRLRQYCAWGQPGRQPYRGSVEQALLAARLPAEVVRQVAAQVRAHQPEDRLSIANDGIRAERSGEVFDPQRVALTFGMTMCLGSRVNFPAGHVERADLYLARDAAGRRHAVMVPEVCGNVSVLSSGGVAPGVLPTALADDGTLVVTADDTPALRAAAASASPPERHSVAEPGTLYGVGLGLALLVLLRRRRRA